MLERSTRIEVVEAQRQRNSAQNQPSDAIVLSVLIPTHNSQSTILDCIQSVLEQRTNFAFEIIVIDDGSIDETTNFVQNIFESSEIHRLIILPENLGKGAAVSLGYREAKGRYIQVLDSDDYLVGSHKFQKQVSFLEKNHEYVAVAHNTIVNHLEENCSLISKQLVAKSFSYEQVMRFEVYFHTSSVLFRKAVTELPKAFQNVKSFRGDSAFMYFHVFKTKLALFYMPEIMSIYTYHKRGIWSRMSPLEQQKFTLTLFSELQEFIVDDPYSKEHFWLSEKIDYLKISDPVDTTYKTVSIDELLNQLCILTGQVNRPEIMDRIKDDTFVFRFVDSLSEAISKILKITYPRVTIENSNVGNSKEIVLLLSGFSQTGGGIFGEIQSLIKIHQSLGYRVVLISTEEVEAMVMEWPAIFASSRVEIHRATQTTKCEKVIFIQNILRCRRSERLYCFFSHHDVVGNASIFPGASKSVILHFVYDHISTLGLLNSSFDKVLCKFRSQAERLSDTVKDPEIILVPPFVDSIFEINPLDISSFEKINSASGSVREYKFEYGAPEEYISTIALLLERFGGTHFHFGPMSETFHARLLDELRARNIETVRFVLLPFSLNFQEDLLKNKIAIFLPPFPIPSINMSIKVLASGIAIIAPQGLNQLIEIREIIGPDQFYWSPEDNLPAILENMSPDKVIRASELGFRKYMQEHSLSAAVENFRELRIWEPSKLTSSNPFLDLGEEKIIDLEEFVGRIF